MTVFVFVGSLLALMALGMPVAFALIGCGITMMYYMGMTDPQIVIQNMWDGANSFPLLAVPFFMLAGEFMNAGGMTRRIITMAMAWVGHIRGGLGYVAVVRGDRHGFAVGIGGRRHGGAGVGIGADDAQGPVTTSIARAG